MFVTKLKPQGRLNSWGEAQREGIPIRVYLRYPIGITPRAVGAVHSSRLQNEQRVRDYRGQDGQPSQSTNHNGKHKTPIARQFLPTWPAGIAPEKPPCPSVPGGHVPRVWYSSYAQLGKSETLRRRVRTGSPSLTSTAPLSSVQTVAVSHRAVLDNGSVAAMAPPLRSCSKGAQLQSGFLAEVQDVTLS
jgi:hypothetical protein